MIKLIVSGCNGYMGRVITELAKNDPDFSIVAGFDINTETSGGYPVYKDPAGFAGEANVVVDFSSPSALDSLLSFGVSRKIPLVLCTTGYSPEQLTAIETTSRQIPVFRSGNMSLGINLLADLVKRAGAVLGNAFDIEIVERHHRRKVDAPSGTALMLAEAAASALPYEPGYTYERQSRRQPRETHEIGISSVRGGTIVGRHDVIFAGLHETIEISHNAESRVVFASGALVAARFMAGKNDPGLFDMSSVLSAADF